jgi:hypothetical protein
MSTHEMREALRRIQTEYVEMPELKLTLPQAQRLWNLSFSTCNDALTILLAGGFLRQTDDGSYMRQGAPPLRIESMDLAGVSERAIRSAGGQPTGRRQPPAGCGR